MALHNRLGQAGEKLACDYLVSRGYVVRDVNWRLNHLEVDIVAQEEQARVLHIVEVKTRSENDDFDFMQTITPKKIRNLVNAANGYVHHYNLDIDIQFDVMIVVKHQDDTMSIDFYPHAFEVPLYTYR